MALDEMDKALAEIKKEKRRIESLPPEAFEQMADMQRRTRDKALDVLEEMKEAPKPKPEDQNASQSGQQPGQQKMEQAGDAMKQASNDLQEQNADQAKQEQKKAEQQMAEALDEIEERLNQLREETREEKLARLESRFREMLDRQQITSIMTIELDDKRTNLGDLRRRDQLLVLHWPAKNWRSVNSGNKLTICCWRTGPASFSRKLSRNSRKIWKKLPSCYRTSGLTVLPS